MSCFLRSRFVPLLSNLKLSNRFTFNVIRNFSTEQVNTSLETEIADYYQQSGHYDHIWGSAIHPGYFPHLENTTNTEVSWEEACELLTSEMGVWSNMNSNSRVLDFGCGYGTPAIHLAKTFGCHVTGIDLTERHIARAVELKEQNSNLDLSFYCGSFVDLPQEIITNKFTHVFSQLAVCHVANMFDEVIDSVSSVLESGGIFVNCEFLVCDSGPSNTTLDHFYKRLHFQELMTPTKYVSHLTSNGFDVTSYIDLSSHANYSYQYLATNADKHNFMSKDGTPLSVNYQNTAHLFDTNDTLMAVIVARKR